MSHHLVNGPVTEGALQGPVERCYDVLLQVSPVGMYKIEE